MAHAMGKSGYELINTRLVDSVLVVDHLVNGQELRVGSGPNADVVRIVRGAPVRIDCPGSPQCPVWPDRLAGR
jgi:hypothetical protein